MSCEKEQVADTWLSSLSSPLSIGAFSSLLENVEEIPPAWLAHLFLLKLIKGVSKGRGPIGLMKKTQDRGGLSSVFVPQKLMLTALRENLT